MTKLVEHYNHGSRSVSVHAVGRKYWVLRGQYMGNEYRIDWRYYKNIHTLAQAVSMAQRIAKGADV